MIENKIADARALIPDAIMGNRLLQIFDALTAGRNLRGSVTDITRNGDTTEKLYGTTARLSGTVSIPGVENDRFLAVVAGCDIRGALTVVRLPDPIVSASEEAKRPVAGKLPPGEKVIDVRTGLFNSKGQEITEFQPDGNVRGLAHIISVSAKPSRIGMDSELLYDKMLGTLRELTEAELGDQASAMLFFKD